ncbi:Rrf2 family transcriptional regulator [Roseomonas sp. KE0001]|uniref:Rrf2 family transcriptional regulator n=1 Tax=unclassified Roseomonas TaxID=2617492 RepID=UPI0018DFE666|nr:Rrf2 family transcriptional regulator [Roseomonas sp. KE0001]MBI0432765.1 Rrf2 family transcriptional regulator [Roseomonas sp. KE0001]
MRLSTRGRYAVMAMAELAIRMRDRELSKVSHAVTTGEEEACLTEPPVSLSDIAQAQQLSVAYLEQLFARMRRAGLVASARGAGGGYRLSRPAARISIGAIIAAVEEPISATRCEVGGTGCVAGRKCLTHDLWHELGEQIRLFLTETSLADVIEGRVRGRAAPPLAL